MSTTTSDYRDIDLIKRLKQDDPKVMEEIYSRYKSKLRSFLLKRNTDPNDIEDLIQIIMFKLWKARYGVKEVSLSGYMHAIAINESLNLWRKNTKGIQIEYVDSYRMTENSKQNPVINNVLKEEIDASFENIDPNLQKTLRLWLWGYTYREIGKQENLSIGTVKSRVFRGKDAIKNDIKNKLWRMKLHKTPWY